jgi:hypothetical protein
MKKITDQILEKNNQTYMSSSIDLSLPHISKVKIAGFSEKFSPAGKEEMYERLYDKEIRQKYAEKHLNTLNHSPQSPYTK